MKRVAWLAVLCLGCNSTEPIPTDLLPDGSFELAPDITLDRAMLVTSSSSPGLYLVFTNHGGAEQDVVYGNCIATLLAYPDAKPDGAPAWSSKGPHYPEGCGPDIAFVAKVPPGGGGFLLRLGDVPSDVLHDPDTGRERTFFVLVRVRGETAVRTLRAVLGAPPP